MKSPFNNESSLLKRVQSRAQAVLGDRYYRHWLNTPKLALGNRIPSEVAVTEQGACEVLNLLGRIEHGVFS